MNSWALSLLFQNLTWSHPVTFSTPCALFESLEPHLVILPGREINFVVIYLLTMLRYHEFHNCFPVVFGLQKNIFRNSHSAQLTG
jgi:hypothetical protein